MSAKRLRIFAGPNGSGKSTFVRNFPENNNLNLGVYVNADDIEALLQQNRMLPLQQFHVDFTAKQVQQYFMASQFAPVKLNNPHLWQHFLVVNGYLKISEDLSVNSYIAADIAELIRWQLMRQHVSFSFETVMSDSNKLIFIAKAKEEGYKIYLYFFSTEDPDINVSRVQIRVAQYGHSVAEEIIKRRYFSSLEHLKKAVQLSHRAYLFDNSGKVAKLILEVENGETVTLIEPTDLLPNWVNNYLINKAST